LARTEALIKIAGIAETSQTLGFARFFALKLPVFRKINENLQQKRPRTT
jgi:hypothetical protein